jgi:hypothetical protein
MEKILLIGRNGYYNPVRKTKDGLNLEPDLTKKQISAKMVVPYGFDFRFGGMEGTDFIKGYTHQDYEKYGYEKLRTHEDYGKINLDLTIKGLEELVIKKGADFVLVDNLCSRDARTFWDIRGRAQLLIDTKLLGTPA